MTWPQKQFLSLGLCEKKLSPVSGKNVTLKNEIGTKMNALIANFNFKL
jgi:hypothetical protein